jgi:hypothetical protein
MYVGEGLEEPSGVTQVTERGSVVRRAARGNGYERLARDADGYLYGGKNQLAAIVRARPDGSYDGLNRLRVRLKKAGLIREFAAVMEVQKRGALHLHVLQTGEYIQKSRLKGMAKAAGFGRCTDIPAAQGDEDRGRDLVVRARGMAADLDQGDLARRIARSEAVGLRE